MSVLKTYEDQNSSHPSLTWKIKGSHAEGLIDGLEAVEQAIELTIETERYKWPIYSADYGIELTELIGKRREYIQGDIERRLSDALAEDDRIIGTRDFSVVFQGERANIRIIAETKYGEILIERSVPIG